MADERKIETEKMTNETMETGKLKKEKEKMTDETEKLKEEREKAAHNAKVELFLFCMDGLSGNKKIDGLNKKKKKKKKNPDANKR